MCLAIIRWNMSDEAHTWVDEKLGIQYSDICSEMLSQLDKILKKKKLGSHTNEYRHQRNFQRI